MAEVTPELIQHVASLAKLKLTDEDLKYYQTRLGQVIAYFDQMDKLTGVLGKDWRGDTLGSPTPERDDQAEPFPDTDLALEQAPSKVGTAFQVPKIIE